MELLTECLFCGKRLYNYVFYHPSCFSLSRYVSRGLQAIVQPYIANRDPYFRYCVSDHFKIKEQEDRLVRIFFGNTGFSDKATISEDDVLKVTDYELYYFRRYVDWRFFSEHFTNKYPDQLWKILPYIKWDILSGRNILKEDFIISFSDFVDFHQVLPKNLTKNLVYKFHARINWSSIGRTSLMDKETVKRFHNKYNLDWWYLLRYVALSDYELEKYEAAHNLGWKFIFDYSNQKLSPTIIRRHHLEIFGPIGSPDKLIVKRQIPSDLLDLYANRLDWQSVIETQTTLEEWFIKKYHDKLTTLTKEHLVTARNFIKEIDHLPAIYLLKDNRWQQYIYPKDDATKLPKPIQPIFPDAKQLENSRIVYYTGASLINYEKRGLRFVPDGNPPYYEVIEPWKFSGNTMIPTWRMRVNDSSEIISNYFKYFPSLIALYVFSDKRWRKEIYHADDLLLPQSIDPIFPDSEYLKKFQLVYYTSAHLENHLSSGLQFFPNENPPFYKAVKPWKLYSYDKYGYARWFTAPRPTLRFILKRNGFRAAKDRSKSFNKFLKEHKCL